MKQAYGAQPQASRQGKSAITFFVKPEAKSQIVAALADGGFGTNYQERIVGLINQPMLSQGRKTIT